jgi:adsorption protein B
LRAGLPSSGVGCAFSRVAIDRIVERRGGSEPFAAECLTEDYEAGLLVSETGGKSCFLRVRDQEGRIVATREFFPSTLTTSVRQKTRWLHGIAFQGWERLGWSGRGCDLWMRVRDRRGALVALVLTAAYVLILVSPFVRLGEAMGAITPLVSDPSLKILLLFNLFSFIWRMALRFWFTAHEYGCAEGIRAILRFPVGNIISIMAGRRALMAYLRVLLGGKVQWEHTVHLVHPAHLIKSDAGNNTARLARQ